MSIINKLKNENKVDDQFLVSLNSLKLEDLIAIKLELASVDISNRLYGFDIWRRTPYIVKDALLKYSLSVAKSKKDAARFLGLTYAEYMKHLKDFNTREYFDGKNKHN
tara:strand:- start:219 stop:542 length:324 start_codon:yes stop_codon:yes gene_type:complete